MTKNNSFSSPASTSYIGGPVTTSAINTNCVITPSIVDDWMRQSVDQFLSSINWGKSPIFSEYDSAWATTHPRVNSFFSDKEGQEKLVIDFIVPYFSENDIEVEIDPENNLVEVSGKKPDIDSNVADVNHITRVQARSAFKKTLRVTSDKKFNFDGVDATHENGVLRITIPVVKPEEYRKKVKLNEKKNRS